MPSTQPHRNEGHLTAGIYFVATPIGNARDITLRALDILSAADVIAAEDTRNTRRLCEIHGISLTGRRVIAYHDHSAERETQRLVEMARDHSVAVVSDAGMPLVSDPGFELARAAAEAGVAMTTAPGPSAPLAALALSGLPSDRFSFLGFLPNARSARKRSLQQAATMPGTLIFFESARRIADSLADMAEAFGPERPAALCRELTKKFEEVRRARLSDLAAEARSRAFRGEIVVVVGPAPPPLIEEADIRAILREKLEFLSVRDSVAETVSQTKGPRKLIYKIALELQKEQAQQPGSRDR